MVNHSYFLYITITARYLKKNNNNTKVLRMYGNKIFQKEMYKHNWEENFQHIYWLVRVRLREEKKKKEEKIGLFNNKKKLYYIKKILLFGCTERVWNKRQRRGNSEEKVQTYQRPYIYKLFDRSSTHNHFILELVR